MSDLYYPSRGELKTVVTGKPLVNTVVVPKDTDIWGGIAVDTHEAAMTAAEVSQHLLMMEEYRRQLGHGKIWFNSHPSFFTCGPIHKRETPTDLNPKLLLINRRTS